MPETGVELPAAAPDPTLLDRLDESSAVCLRIYLRVLYALVLTAAAIFGIVALAHGIAPLPFLLHAADALSRAWKAAG
jgi:hypothetical protein